MHGITLDLRDAEYIENLGAGYASPLKCVGIVGEALRIGVQRSGGQQALAAEQLEHVAVGQA
ncbi:hypothetical protein D3C84_1242640 [compost metagenome]